MQPIYEACIPLSKVVMLGYRYTSASFSSLDPATLYSAVASFGRLETGKPNNVNGTWLRFK